MGNKNSAGAVEISRVSRVLCATSCLGRAGMDNVDALRHRETTRHVAQVSGASCISKRGGSRSWIMRICREWERRFPDGSRRTQKPVKARRIEGRHARTTGTFPHRHARNSISQASRESFIGNVHWQCHQCRANHIFNDAVIHQNARLVAVSKSDASKLAVNAAGTALVFLLYAISVAALWHLL